MRFARLLAAGLATAAFAFSHGSTLWAQDDGGAKPLVTMPSLVEAITKSKTPSEAVDQYARAYAATGGDTMTEQAFVVRMVDFGMPEMAEKQAEDLSIRTSSGMSYAVLAFSSARADKLDQAILHIEAAVRASPNDNFVARTAGEVLAWYDVRKATAVFEPAVQQAAEYVRERMESRRPFTSAYNEVHDPIQAIYSGGDQGNKMVLANMDLATLGAFSGSSQGGFTSPMALFYTAPYALFPSYNYWYQPVGANAYYYQNWWQRGVGAGRLFPFPAIDRDTRFMKISGGGFALVSDEGTSLYQPLGSGPIWSPGYYGGYGNYYGNYNGGGYFNGFGPALGGGGFIFQGRPAFGPSQAMRSRIGPSRMSQRLNLPSPGISSGNDFSVGRNSFAPPLVNNGRRFSR